MSVPTGVSYPNPTFIPTSPGLLTTLRTTSAAISLNASAANGDNIVIAGTSLQTIRVHRMFFTVSAAVNITFYDGASPTTPLSGAIQLQGAGSSVTLDISGEPWYATSAGNGFNIFSSAAVNINGTIWYVKS